MAVYVFQKRGFGVYFFFCDKASAVHISWCLRHVCARIIIFHKHSKVLDKTNTRPAIEVIPLMLGEKLRGNMQF